LNVPLKEVRQLIGQDSASSASSSSNAMEVADAMAAPAKKRRKAADGGAIAQPDEEHGVHNSTEVPSNIAVMTVMKLLKSNILEFIEHLTSVKIWIQLNIPRIEDGNNFGVTIQEETLSELGRAEEAAFATLESGPKYFLLRAKYITKSLKYPGVTDYRNAIYELDEKEYINMCMTIKELRNNYSILHDMISKNWDKIRKPRSESSMSIY
jgi:proteasome activator subunit 2 (PA28 beta)